MMCKRSWRLSHITSSNRKLLLFSFDAVLLITSDSKKYLQRAVQKLNIKKNLTKSDWNHIRTVMAQRDALGKSSIVMAHGKTLDLKTVRREIRRHCYEDIFQQIERRKIPKGLASSSRFD